jgi:NTP pyrophosphatase (non-canonical NTP hydrolase)
MLSDLRDGGDDAELAPEGVDEIIRVLDLLDMHGESAGQSLIEKMRENKGRPRMHGRQA